jgi:P27 family predicted phage terminase small subunit
MGRKKKPTNLHILSGTHRKDRQNPNEPAINPEIPDPPDHLSKFALVEWGRITPQLYRLGLLSQIDRPALAIYCQAYGRWKDAEEQLAQSSVVIKTQSGNVIQNPLVGIANKAMEHMRKSLALFGMSPADRAKVTANKKEGAKDEWAQNF